MIIPTVIMALLAFVLLWIGYRRGGGEHVKGLKAAGLMTLETLPLLIFAYVVAGMIKTVLPQDLITRWVGPESGLRGLFIGTAAGGLTPGGPFVSMPVVAGLIKSGASIGTVVAFLTGWSLIAVGRLPIEIGIIGWKAALIRLGCSFFFAPLAGWLAQILFGSVKI